MYLSTDHVRDREGLAPSAATRHFRFLGGRDPRERTRTPVVAAAPQTTRDGRTVTMRLYDPIDSWGESWGVSAKEFVEALDAVGDVDEVRLHINSPGGEVFEGIAILNALRNSTARIVVVVDGLAASAASFVAMAGDEIVMARNSELMIHDAWGIAIGNAADMRDMADRLDQLSDNIASVYAERAGGDVAQWRAAMAAESWYTAEEAVEAGLADRVEAPPQGKAQAAFDLSVFKHAGRAAAPPPQVAKATPTDAPADAGAAAPSGEHGQHRSPVQDVMSELDLAIAL